MWSAYEKPRKTKSLTACSACEHGQPVKIMKAQHWADCPSGIVTCQETLTMSLWLAGWGARDVSPLMGMPTRS